MTTDAQQDTISVTDDSVAAASTAGSATPESPEDAAKKLLAKARYDAFRLVTDARAEAESILDEARSQADRIVREAKEAADDVLDAAGTGQWPGSDGAPHGPAPEPSSAVADLDAEHHELAERVGSLRALAEELEARFAALTSTPIPTPATAMETPGDLASTAGSPAGIDFDEAPAPSLERGSFYSRRSAKLPSIGEAGGKSALDMMRSIRETIEEPED